MSSLVESLPYFEKWATVALLSTHLSEWYRTPLEVCFAALCIQPTVISTIVTVREMCLQLLDDLCMYPTKFDRAVTEGARASTYM